MKRNCTNFLKNFFCFLFLFFAYNAVHSQMNTYSFSEAIIPYEPLTTGTTTVFSGNFNNGNPVSVNLPFSFRFLDYHYNSIYISDNGYITFGTTPPPTNIFTPISDGTAYDGAISAMGFNLQGSTANGSQVLRATLGTVPNRVFVVEWKNVVRVNYPGLLNFQIHLYEGSNIIKIHYGACSPTNNNTNNEGGVQVGLRGAGNLDFFNRRLINTNATWYQNTIFENNGNANILRLRNTIYPQNGLAYTYAIGVPAAADLDYIEGFELTTHKWKLMNGKQTNKWTTTTSVQHTGVRSLHISTNGNNYGYNNVGSAVHAVRDINVLPTDTQVGIYFDWRNQGDEYNNDFLRVWLVPATYLPLPGTTIQEGGGRIKLNDRLSRSDNFWLTQYNDYVDVSSFAGSKMRLIFEWINDGLYATNFPAAVDNVRVMRYCSGVPNGGTATVSPGTGLPSSTFVLGVTGGTQAAGIRYQWQMAETATGPWTDIEGKTSETATLTAISLPEVTRYYRRSTYCIVSNELRYSTVGSFTTINPTYCTPTAATPIGLHIVNVKVYGMDPLPINSNSTYATNGYSSYVDMPNLIAKQAQGEGINVESNINGNLFGRGRWKAWVDWNSDGDFTDAGEEVYDVGAIIANSLNFGFQIPANQTPGNYRLRIRVNNGATYFQGNWYENAGTDYSACTNFINSPGTGDQNGYGETEDYMFTVVENCAAKIQTIQNESECLVEGGVSFTLTATSNIPVTEFRWYTSESGGAYTVSYPDATGMATTWNTPAITANTLYYVTAVAGCESTFRTEVSAVIKPRPTVNFTPTTFEVCGQSSVIEISATGGNEIAHLINENFEAGTLGVFTNQVLENQYANANFTNKTSVFRPSAPPFMSWLPALSSGFGTNKFAFSSADYFAEMNLKRGLLSPIVSTIGFENLTLKFRILFSRYFQDNAYPESEYAAIEITENNGGNWTELERFTADVGKATRFVEKTYNLDSYKNKASVRFRFVIYSEGDDEGWLATGIAIDDVELFGEKALEPSFDWVSNNPINVYLDPEGTTEYTGGAISTVYIKPTLDQLEAYTSWNMTATVELSNGCQAEGSLSIENDSKVWNSASTNWITTNWKPTNSMPTADNCVVVRSPVNIPNAADGLAKTIEVEPGGKLNILGGGSLTITDFIANNAAAGDFVVESDANLLQNTPGAANTGKITVKRTATVPSIQYNYWSSPVVGQDLYNLYPNIPTNRIMTYNTWDDYFTTIPYGSLSTFGKGYSVKGPTSGGPNVTGIFVGVPQNESLTATENIIPLSGVGNRFNLIGNPYPSNLDLKKLHTLNSSQFYDGNDDTHAFFFWDNTSNTYLGQQGSGYVGLNYAMYNPVSDIGTAAPTGNLGKKPNGIVKPGQGFIIRASANPTGIVMDNDFRTKDVKHLADTEDAPYYKNGTKTLSTNSGDKVREDKFWLELINPKDLYIQMAVGYFPEAENRFELYDSPILEESVSDNIYTFSLEGKKLTINGRKGPFDVEDIIPMGVKAFKNGRYRIHLDEKLGIFKENQIIYIKDKYLNVYHNLLESDYGFETEAGVFEDRFDIVFKIPVDPSDDPILTTASEVTIQKVNEEIQINSTTHKITEVEIYNLAGWSIYNNKSVNSLKIWVSSLPFGKQILFVKAKTETGEVYTQKIIN